MLIFENSIPIERNKIKHKTPSTHCGPIFLNPCARAKLLNFARAFADAIQRAHKDIKKQSYRQWSGSYLLNARTICVIYFLFFATIERSVLKATVFYYKDV